MLVLGAGSIGTLFACDAAKRLGTKTPVSLLVRNRAQTAITQCQIVNEAFGPQNIRLVDAAGICNERFDVALFACKQYDLTSLSQTLREANCKADLGISLSNGLGAVEHIQRGGAKLGEILGAVTYAGASLVKPGQVRRNNAPGAQTLLQRPQDARLAQVLLDAIPNLTFAETAMEMERLVWKKLLANVCINPLTAIFDIPNGQVPSVCASFLPELIREFHQVCPVKDLGLGLDFVESICKLTANNTSSMLADVKHARRTEIDALNGALLQLARAQNVHLPTNQFLYQCVAALELKNKQLAL